VIDAIVRKARESAELKLSFIEKHAALVERAARLLADRLAGGGRLFTAGNGGSSCDAQHVAVEFMHPVLEKRRPLPALALGIDAPLVSAIGNDSDFARVFTEPLELLAGPGDALLAISTSGAAANLNRALRLARQRGLLTLGFAGKDGGAMVDLCEICLVVPSWSVHRIQETHTLLLHLLWDQVHVALGEDDVL
jgi:D-sedoheptulose 7-phosphate isomerase